jgi:hypothetical protein
MATELQNALEALIDRTSLEEVVEALRGICFDKAEHIEHTWQDVGTAQVWRKAAQFFSRPNASVQAL